MSDNKEVSIEESLGHLEAILARMEEKECSLEECFQLYKDGIGLLQSCQKTLNQVEDQLLILREGVADGV